MLQVFHPNNVTKVLLQFLKVHCGKSSNIFIFHLIFFRILALEKLGAVFNEVHYNLKYTPRRFVCHQSSGNMIIIETDHGAFNEKAKRRRREESANVNQLKVKFKNQYLFKDVMSLAQTEEEKQMASEVAHSLLNYEPDESTFGAPPAHSGAWASAVRMLSARNGATLCNYELPEGEAAFRFDLNLLL